MENKLHILIVEDLPSDAELAERELRTVIKNYKVQVVDTKEGFEQSLETFKPDLIISDYKMPVFDGLSALMLKQKKSPFTPFIILTGSMNEDTAVECMKAGADDYVIKEHIKRLGTAALKAIEKKKNELKYKQAQKELRRLSTAIQQSPSVIIITDINGNMEYVNPKFTKLTGYTSKEVIGKNPRILSSDEQTDEIYKELWNTISSGKEWHGEFYNKKKNEELFWEAASISPIFDKQGKIVNYLKVAENITERKQAEKALKEQQRYTRGLIEANLDAFVMISAQGEITDLNSAMELITGISRKKLISTDFPNYFTNPDAARKGCQQAFRDGYVKDYPLEFKHSDGKVTPVLYNANIYKDRESNILGVFAVARDISKRKKTEEELKDKMQKLEKWNKLTVGRELKMIELKKEINALLKKAKLSEKYDIRE